MATKHATTEVLRETSKRLAIPLKRLEVATSAAANLESEAFGVVERLVQLNQDKSREERLERAAKSVSEALDRFTSGHEDPLADVDEATEDEALRGQLESEFQSQNERVTILANCVGAEEAAKRAQQSRQRVEELRREGKLLALRVKNCWRYPRWQFDPDFTGGVVPGLGEVLSHLQLSPTGSAAWLTEVFEVLGNQTPIELLKTGRTQEVIRLAKEHGHMP
jgi:hypothetical protein